MLKIDRKKQSFTLLDAPTLADVSITERYDLQEFISNSPDAFFKEIGLELFLIGNEIEPSNDVQDRIDLLALDKEGRSVVVELKRGSHKLHMLQAISYASMIAHWDPEDFLQSLDEEQQDALTDFLEVDRDDINRQQRIMLIAEGYDYALLIAAEWLTEQYGVDITCCRIAVAKDSATGSEYLVCSNIYPAPELAEESVSRGRKHAGTNTVKWADWKAALAGVKNLAIKSYFEQELAADRESYLRKRILRYRLGGKRRWFVAARTKNAYVWQQGRFDGDIDFWKAGLVNPEVVKPVKNGQCLRLFLDTAEELRFFHDAATQQLDSTQWLGGVLDEDIDDTPVNE